MGVDVYGGCQGCRYTFRAAAWCRYTLHRRRVLPQHGAVKGMERKKKLPPNNVSKIWRQTLAKEFWVNRG